MTARMVERGRGVGVRVVRVEMGLGWRVLLGGGVKGGERGG